MVWLAMVTMMVLVVLLLLGAKLLIMGRSVRQVHLVDIV